MAAKVSALARTRLHMQRAMNNIVGDIGFSSFGARLRG
jgi:hypothetical protein